MKKIGLTLEILLLVVCLSFKNSALSNKVCFEVHFAPNFVSSIYSVGEVGFGKDPQLKYVDMTPSDKEVLQQSADLIRFGNGKSGAFVFATYFLPCYLDISTASEYAVFVADLKQALLANDFAPFLKRYPVDFTDVFMASKRSFFSQSSTDWEKKTKPLLERYFKVLDIFVKYAAPYESQFWPEDRSKLQERANHFNAYFEKENLIGKWEQLLGVPFGRDYRIYLCRHNSYGPDANSICFDRNIFNGFKYENMVVDFVSHEVGTHMLYKAAWLDDDLKVQRKENYEVFYAAFESLAMFYNAKILGKHLSYDMEYFRGAEFTEIYNNIYHPKMSTQELLRCGVEQMAPKWNK